MSLPPHRLPLRTGASHRRSARPLAACLCGLLALATSAGAHALRVPPPPAGRPASAPAPPAVRLSSATSLAAIPAAAVQGAPSEGGGSGGVTHLAIEGPLDAGTLALLRRGVMHAREAGHDVLVLELDTPGGALELLWKLVKAMDRAMDTDLLLVAWVHDRALSAGVLVALACDAIYVDETATIGASAVVRAGPHGMTALPEEGEVREKILSYLRAEYRGRAEARGRPGLLAEAMVDYEVEVHEVRDGAGTRLVSGDEWDRLRMSGEPPELVRTIDDGESLLTLDAREALALGFVDGRADDLAEVCAKIGYPGAVVDTLERARSEDLLAWLDTVSGLLLAMGLFFGYAELKAPGFGLPGALAVLCFALLVGGRWLVGLADVPEIVMIGAGVGLVAVELFLLPGTLWAGLAGGALVLGGLVLIQLGPGFGLGNPLDRELLLDATLRLFLAGTGAAVAVVALSRFLPNAPILRRLVLEPAATGDFGSALGTERGAPRPGALGVARTALRPVGKVALDGAADVEHEARAEGDALPAGARVRVVEVQGGRLLVAGLAAERPATPPAQEGRA